MPAKRSNKDATPEPEPTPRPTNLLTYAEAQGRLRVSLSGLKRLLRPDPETGVARLDVRTIGHKRLITEASVEALIEEGKAEAAS